MTTATPTKTVAEASDPSEFRGEALVPAPESHPVPHPLDHPAYSSLTGPHAHFAERRGNVVRYPVDVSPFVALPENPTAQDWVDIAALAGPGRFFHWPGLSCSRRTGGGS